MADISFRLGPASFSIMRLKKVFTGTYQVLMSMSGLLKMKASV